MVENIVPVRRMLKASATTMVSSSEGAAFRACMVSSKKVLHSSVAARSLIEGGKVVSQFCSSAPAEKLERTGTLSLDD